MKYGLLILLLLWLASIPLAMQFDTGSIDGVIMDEAGSVSNASVDARNVLSGAEFHAESDAVGYFKLENLPSGRYSLWVRAAGHDSLWVPSIPMERGEAVHQNLHLGRSHRGASGI
jgi:hypothetical protein